MAEIEVAGVLAEVHDDGHLYVRRDLVVDVPLGGRRFYPQHAVLREGCRRLDHDGAFDVVEWVGHPQGGVMEPLIRSWDEPGCGRYELPGVSAEMRNLGPDAGDPEDEDEFDNPWIGD